MFNLKRAINPKKVIEQIHNEFDTAGEKLLQEAKTILSNEAVISKAERLKKIGFHCASSVTILSERDKKMAIAQKIEYFRTYYPNNKFITKEMVESICKKYNLLCAEIGQYRGDVPLKNLAEIEAFSLRQEDMKKVSEYDRYIRREAARDMMNMQMSALSGVLGLPRYEYIERTAPSVEDTKRMMENFSYEKASLCICAPETDFNTSGMSKRGVFLVPDPIVLQPVDGGYLIVSKWGLEASDPGVVNETHN